METPNYRTPLPATLSERDANTLFLALVNYVGKSQGNALAREALGIAQRLLDEASARRDGR